MFSKFGFVVAVSVALLGAIPTTLIAQVSFSVQGPGVDPNDFRITQFADGLNFPVGMVELDDGSLLVATNNGNSFYGSSTGSLVRLTDSDADGIAESRETLVDDVPGGKLSALRRSGDLLFVTGQGAGVPISIYRLGATAAAPPSLAGSLTIHYAGSWLHPHSALAARPTPGVPDSHDLFFQLGSQTNFDATTETRPLTSNIGSAGDLAGDAIHRIQIADQGGSLAGGPPVQIATGLRNAAGMAFHPLTGDLYLQDNGIDGVHEPIEPTSADEINVLAAADIGGTIEDFGFPSTYSEYRTGTQIGNQGIAPAIAFQPLPSPDGAEAEGPNDIVFAPPSFPAALRDGLFVGFHGQFSRGGLANEENPLAFVDLVSGTYFQFINSAEASVGHLDGLLATDDSLYVADLSPGGGLGPGDRNSGKIYQIQAISSPLSGDYDDDGDVDGADFLVLQRAASGQIATWKDNYGAGISPLGSAAIPEPASAGLALIAAAVAVGRRRGGFESDIVRSAAK